MIEFNITLVFQFVNFLLGLLIINHFIIKPLREVMARRNALVDGLDTDANTLDTQAKSKLSEYEASLQNVRSEVVRTREAVKIEAHARAHEMQLRAEEEARKFRYDAEQRRRNESESAYTKLSAQSSSFADSIVKRLLA